MAIQPHLLTKPARADPTVIMPNGDSAERAEEGSYLHVEEIRPGTLKFTTFQENLPTVLQAFGAVEDYVDLGVGAGSSDISSHYSHVVHNAWRNQKFGWGEKRREEKSLRVVALTGFILETPLLSHWSVLASLLHTVPCFISFCPTRNSEECTFFRLHQRNRHKVTNSLFHGPLGKK